MSPALDHETAEIPLKILIIDDELGLRDMLKYGLKKRGYEVTGAANGEEALQLLSAQAFDLAVCDIMMPGIGGVEVLKRIKETQPDIEVIMATGYATLETAIEAMKNGAFDYITKPYSLSHLCMLFKKAEEHRRLKAKVGYLEELNKLKSEFMATMSHELRTPLASMLGYMSLLLRNVYGPVPEKQAMILERVEVNAKNLLGLINNILDLSKLSAHRMTLSPENFVVNDLINEIAEAMEPLTRSKKITLDTQTPPALEVHADRTKVKQILINLIGNAIKFTHVGGIGVSVHTREREVVIEVRDTGIGIMEEDLPKLFQEFKQLDGSATREYSGTGLGLSISKKLAELMAGTIEVKSKKQQGSTFAVHLPNILIQPISGAHLHVPDPEPKFQDGKIILSIDDDPDVLKVLGDSLSGTGLHFVGALSGEEGLSMARQLRPQLITLDVMMPHMDGWLVLKTLKEDPQLKDIPVYMVSVVDNKALAFSLGVTDYILKPFTQDELLEKLKFVAKTRVQQLLVVDNDSHVCQLLTQALTPEGFDVECLGSGEEAMSHMKRLKPDVVFLALVLPKMSGFDVLEAMAQFPPKDPPLVVVMADRELNPDQERYLSGRVKMILKKQAFDLKDVTAILRAHLSKHRNIAS